MAPKTMKNKCFGHLKTRLFTIKNSKNIGLGGPMVNIYIYIHIFYTLKPTVCSWKLMLRRGSFSFWTAHSEGEAARFRERKSSKPEKRKRTPHVKEKLWWHLPSLALRVFCSNDFVDIKLRHTSRRSWFSVSTRRRSRAWDHWNGVY